MDPAQLSGVLLALVLASSGGSDWPQFRGPSGTGVVEEARVPRAWSETEHVAWKVALPGQGWSQPVVVGDTVYVTAAVGEGLDRPLGMQAGIADPRTMKAGAVPDVTIDWRVIALDLASGKERWSRSAAQGKPRHPIHPSNTWASETPCADAGGVYALFGMSGTLVALSPAGEERWRVDLGTYPVTEGFGTGSSPAIHAGKLYVQSFNDETGFLACLDAASGAEVWRAERPAATSWATPLVWRAGERTEVVASSGKLVVAHDPATGKELWRIAGVDGPSMCSFAADEEQLYFGQSSPMGSPPLFALLAGGSGDLSPAAGSAEPRHLAWSQKSASPGMASPVAAGGFVYVIEDTILTCRDAVTGERLYKERVPDVVTVAASPLVVGEDLLLLDEEGRAAFVPLGPEFRVAARAKLDDVFWTTPTVAGDALLLRGVARLYCVRE